MVYDILFLGVVVFFAVIGFRRGAAKTLLSILSLIVAAVASMLLSRMFSQFIFDAFIRQSIIDNINTAISDSVIGDAATSAAAVVAALPRFALSAMSYFGAFDGSFENYCADVLTLSDADPAATITEAVMPSITGAISTILGIILFVVLLFLLRKLSNLIAKIFKLPLLRTVNSFVGGIIGILEGVAAVCVLAALVKLILPLFSADFASAGEQYIENSYIFSLIYSGKLTSWIQLFVYNVGKLMNN